MGVAGGGTGWRRAPWQRQVGSLRREAWLPEFLRHLAAGREVGRWSHLGCLSPAAYRLEDTYGPDPTMMRANCLVQTTEWSACSKTCGMGISTRVTNDNAFCRLEKQSRLCMVRPCEADLEENIKVDSLVFVCDLLGCFHPLAKTQRLTKECAVLTGSQFQAVYLDI